jgi:hypothetical protein
MVWFGPTTEAPAAAQPAPRPALRHYGAQALLTLALVVATLLVVEVAFRIVVPAAPAE